MKAIVVCVEYEDFLTITLPYNRHHFESVLIVTSTKDEPIVSAIAKENEAHVFATDAFYLHGARFNKFLALEKGLDVLGRDGWICVMDADVLWPKVAPLEFAPGTLTTPLRRMFTDMRQSIPRESDWCLYPVHRNIGEWAGYSQVFHADDPVLGPRPWHEVDWSHAGGGDTMFQRKWPSTKKLRPTWTCLHLGLAGRNWCGRSTQYIDGTEPHGSAMRAEALREIMAVRKRTGGYDREKI